MPPQPFQAASQYVASGQVPGFAAEGPSRPDGRGGRGPAGEWERPTYDESGRAPPACSSTSPADASAAISRRRSPSRRYRRRRSAVQPLSRPSERIAVHARRVEPIARNPHAAALGHLGGLRGGVARAAALSPRRRRGNLARRRARPVEQDLSQGSGLSARCAVLTAVGASDTSHVSRVSGPGRASR